MQISRRAVNKTQARSSIHKPDITYTPQSPASINVPEITPTPRGLAPQASCDQSGTNGQCGSDYNEEAEHANDHTNDPSNQDHQQNNETHHGDDGTNHGNDETGHENEGHD